MFANYLCILVCVTTGYCYTMWNLKPALTKQQALNHCHGRNQTLATITTVKDEMTLAGHLGSDGKAWIGLNMVPTADWKWFGGMSFSVCVVIGNIG